MVVELPNQHESCSSDPCGSNQPALGVVNNQIPESYKTLKKVKLPYFFRFCPLRNFWGTPGETVPTKVVMCINTEIFHIGHLGLN